MLIILICFLITLKCVHSIWRPEKPDYHTLNKVNLRRKLQPRHIQTKVRDADVVIIGGGGAGLSLAAIIARRSEERVVVLDQNEVIGGCFHTFKKTSGVSHDTGLHYVGSEAVRMLRAILGEQTPKFLPVGREGHREYDVYCSKNCTWRAFPGLDAYVAELAPHLSGGARMAREYMREVLKCRKYVKAAFLLRLQPSWRVTVLVQRLILGSYMCLSVEAYLQTKLHMTTQDVRTVTQMAGNYGHASQTAWLVHAGVVRHFLDGAYYPADGPESIASALVRLIEARGSSAYCQANVSQIDQRSDGTVGLVLNGFYTNLQLHTKVVSTVGMYNTQRLLRAQVPRGNLQTSPDFYYLFCEFELQSSVAECARSANTWMDLEEDMRVFVSSGSLKRRDEAPAGTDLEKHTATVIGTTKGPGSNCPDQLTLQKCFYMVYPHAIRANFFTGSPAACEKHLGRRGPYGSVVDQCRLESEHSRLRLGNQVWQCGQDVLLPGVAGSIASAHLLAARAFPETLLY